MTHWSRCHVIDSETSNSNFAAMKLHYSPCNEIVSFNYYHKLSSSLSK
uniref:Uncharacterized protein n=1 Tax=Arundo donax TaxID=35708 RepID=A0A0A8Z5I9_ARUDO